MTINLINYIGKTLKEKVEEKKATKEKAQKELDKFAESCNRIGRSFVVEVPLGREKDLDELKDEFDKADWAYQEAEQYLNEFNQQEYRMV